MNRELNDGVGLGSSIEAAEDFVFLRTQRESRDQTDFLEEVLFD